MTPDWRVKAVDVAMGTVVLACATALLLHGQTGAGAAALVIGLFIALVE